MEVSKADFTSALMASFWKADATLEAAVASIWKDSDPETIETGACVGDGVGDAVVGCGVGKAVGAAVGGVGVGAGVAAGFAVVAVTCEVSSSSSPPQPWMLRNAW
jgi:hypothetical protein